MGRIDSRVIYSIGKKEFADNVRNKWVLALIIVFLILTVAASYLAGGQARDETTLPYVAFLATINVDEDGNLDFLGLEPEDTIIIEDQVMGISSEYNASIGMSITYVQFNIPPVDGNQTDPITQLLFQYLNPIVIEGNHTDDYQVGDTIRITLHIIKVDSGFIKGEFIEELWDEENDLPKFPLPAEVLLEGEGESSIFGGMEATVGTILTISVLLIPIIAIMLGYATISGEAESGALSVVLSYPVRRIEVLLGKYIGLGSVLIVSIVLGFGAGGILIAATAGIESGGAYLVFIGLTVLLGLLYLSLSMCFSAITKKRVTSLAAGVLIFFWAMIYGMIIFGIYLATGGSTSDFISGDFEFPDWLWKSIVLSPGDMYQMSVMQAFGLDQLFGFEVEVPGYMSLGLLVGVQLVWTIVPLILAYYFFKKRDI
jgi:ABC-type transport system involved in multi-copper enzyme maturation permease subunit